MSGHDIAAIWVAFFQECQQYRSLRTGHIASLALAHSLLAETDAERARIAATVCATVDYVVKGGLVYVDPVTGNRTTWGYWDP